jgi:hypothetical protein
MRRAGDQLDCSHERQWHRPDHVRAEVAGRGLELLSLISGFASGFGMVRYLMLPALLYVVLSYGEHVRFNRIIMLDEVGPGLRAHGARQRPEREHRALQACVPQQR